MIWFSSDWHFGHTNILLHQPARSRAFGCVEEMDARLIDQINSVVQPEDEIYFLGDFAWKASKYGHYRQRLNVRRLYVCQGNHDSNSLRTHVTSMRDMICRKFAGHKIHLCHYPLLSWRALYHGSLHLYGHSHGMYEKSLDQMFPGRRAMDVGIDAVFQRTGAWLPISLDEVIESLAGDREPDSDPRFPQTTGLDLALALGE
ncbi:hypothetical protein LCGC14_3066710 [marine sediment metagenome]|uniref:Calcineurin-like phosphoesterase domain-containing protein n=1 Tax=marine sediment metagenome TaxID=412755 RepID=A0A0F8Z7Y2_9ZZZZ